MFRGCEKLKLKFYSNATTIDMDIYVNNLTHWISIPGAFFITRAKDYINELFMSLLEQHGFIALSIANLERVETESASILLIRFEQDHGRIGDLISSASEEARQEKKRAEMAEIHY